MAKKIFPRPNAATISPPRQTAAAISSAINYSPQLCLSIYLSCLWLGPESKTEWGNNITLDQPDPTGAKGIKNTDGLKSFGNFTAEKVKIFCRKLEYLHIISKNDWITNSILRYSKNTHFTLFCAVSLQQISETLISYQRKTEWFCLFRKTSICPPGSIFRWRSSAHSRCIQETDLPLHLQKEEEKKISFLLTLLKI